MQLYSTQKSNLALKKLKRLLIISLTVSELLYNTGFYYTIHTKCN